MGYIIKGKMFDNVEPGHNRVNIEIRYISTSFKRYLTFTIHGFMTVPFIEENDQTAARRQHLAALRALIGNVYPNKFERSDVTETPSGEDTISSIREAFKKYEPGTPAGEKPAAEVLDAANTDLNRIH